MWKIARDGKKISDTWEKLIGNINSTKTVRVEKTK